MEGLESELGEPRGAALLGPQFPRRRGWAAGPNASHPRVPQKLEGRDPAHPATSREPCLVGSSSGAGCVSLGPSAQGHSRSEHCHVREARGETPLREENRPKRQAARGAEGAGWVARGAPSPQQSSELPRHGPSPAASEGLRAAPSARGATGRRLGPQVGARG